jgi:hypothetical protein
MNDVYIGRGKYKKSYEGKGVYAARDFDKGKIVVYYNLTPMDQNDFANLPKNKRGYVHSFWNTMYLFSEPACYVNHSTSPNTKQDLKNMCDIAIKPIKKGEMITTNATIEVQNELETFVEAYEQTDKISNFTWLKGGYRNAVVQYNILSKSKTLHLKRIDGNWKILKIE